MQAKHLATLEFPAIRKRLAQHADFSGGADLALALEPTSDVREAQERLQATQEARVLLRERPDFSLGGVSDIRPLAELAAHGVQLQATELLQVRDTLQAAGTLHKTLKWLETQLPTLADIVWRIQPQPQIVEMVSRVLDDRGEIRNTASPELTRIRHSLQTTQERIRSRLRQMIATPGIAGHLQDTLITQRGGRFVLPVRAEAKGNVRGIVHDRSASGVTLFIEPLSIVEMNNALRELRLAEEAEIARLLRMLSTQVGQAAPQITATLDAFAELDLTLAKARYAEALDATLPTLVPPMETPPPVREDNFSAGTVLRLPQARHPLLDPETVVPVDFLPEPDTHILIITGPNTGGKTVALKTVGLLALMAQAGLHIPTAPGAVLTCFAAIYADIGDEQSIEQNLSTFSAHLNNIVSFLPHVDHRALVLLDELGAGTDPAEGAALARALLETLRARRCMAMVATHYPELKLYAHNTPGVRNASLEFDVETLSPTYHLRLGIPGRSNAFAIAQRLGLPDPIVKQAQQYLSGEDLSAEAMLNDLHRLRIQEAQARDAALAAQREAQQLTDTLRQRLRNIEKERATLLQKTRREARQALEQLHSEIADLRTQLRAVNRAAIPHALDELHHKAETLAPELPEPEPLVESLPRPTLSGPIRVGDVVRLPGLGLQGQVTGIEGDKATVQAGAMRSRVDLASLELLERRPTAPQSEPPPPPPAHSPGIQLDLRGQTVDEALESLARYLDKAVLAGLPWVRIVHGKGTGKLRRAIRAYLNQAPPVVDYEPAPPNEGGDGATIVKLFHKDDE